MQIRPMHVQDVPELYRLGRQEWPSDTWLTERYIQSAHMQPGVSFVATDSNNIVGGIILVLEDIVPQWIRYLIVDKMRRGQGIASALLQKVADELPHGTSMFVDTGSNDVPALAFYGKHGFTIQGTLKELYGSEDGVILRKIL